MPKIYYNESPCSKLQGIKMNWIPYPWARFRNPRCKVFWPSWSKCLEVVSKPQREAFW